ncbi:hypothetical protein Taro_055547 [Colocasia esculenta]|uniref:Ubiquitin-like protease family profile domain-containing protein n=1 Tax=Colocasia esculenta TaxID=4460 RepID=A0A843XRK9_COLES|nr:hypothetical protein [Colocasia esculenta]
MWMEIGKEQVDIEYVDCLLFSMFLNGFGNILKKGVFSKTYTFVPIVDGGHWNLLILCNFGKPLHKDCGPCMILLDSLHMAEPLSKEPNIRRFVRELYKASGRMETGSAINSIPLLLPKVSQQSGGEECDVFMLYYMFLFAMNAPKSFSRTSYPYFRKYDVGESEKKWIMKNISQKWKYHKYALRRKIFKQSKKTIQVNPPEHLHISADMWKEVVKIWTSEHWVWRSEVNRKNKGVQKIFHCAGTQTFAYIRKAELQKSGQEMDRSELFIVTHTRKDGVSVNSECAVAITVASKYDIYSQVLGEDEPDRVRGLGTGPTPATLWERSTDILKDENKKLGDRVKDLEERIAKLERTDSKFQLTSKRVKLLDMYGNQVAISIVMSTDPTKIVMGRPIGQDFREVAVLLANKPDSPLFIKNHNRKTMKDAIGSHILWFLQYVQLDFKRQVGDQD